MQVGIGEGEGGDLWTGVGVDGDRCTVTVTFFILHYCCSGAFLLVGVGLLAFNVVLLATVRILIRRNKS